MKEAPCRLQPCPTAGSALPAPPPEFSPEEDSRSIRLREPGQPDLAPLSSAPGSCRRPGDRTGPARRLPLAATAVHPAGLLPSGRRCPPGAEPDVRGRLSRETTSPGLSRRLEASCCPWLVALHLSSKLQPQSESSCCPVTRCHASASPSAPPFKDPGDVHRAQLGNL